jgi:hypothetical protein
LYQPEGEKIGIFRHQEAPDGGDERGWWRPDGDIIKLFSSVLALLANKLDCISHGSV